MKTCKKLLLSLLSLGLLLTLFGCKQEADGIWPYAIRVDGQVYYCYEEEADIENMEVLGTITSSVNISQGPEIDDQANRSDWVGASYGTADGRMYLYYDNHWLKCYLPAEIG